MVNFQHNSIAMNISRDMAILHGMVKPTPEEVAQYDADYRASWEQDTAAWVEHDAFRAALAEVDDPVARVVLDLHRPVDEDVAECDHCIQGEYGDHEPWPCDTVEAVAHAVGIEPPAGWLGRRPGPEPLTMPPEGFKRWTYPAPFVDALARKMDATVFHGEG